MSPFLHFSSVGLFLVGLAVAAGTVSRADDPLKSILNGPADLEALPQAYGHLEAAQCRSPVCLAIRDIGTAFQIIEERHPPDAQTLLHPESFNEKAWIDEGSAAEIAPARS